MSLVTCDNCGTPFDKIPAEIARTARHYCSIKCVGVHRARLRVESMGSWPAGKTCNQCGDFRALECFRKVHRGLYGRHSVCLQCTRARDAAEKVQRAEAKKAYNRSEAFKQAAKKSRAKFPERTKDRSIFVARIQTGALKPWPVCAVPECTDTHVHGHHPDYSRPLDVVWLCRVHHTEAHNITRAAQNR